ncbi:MAG: toll/interleukin-1 receptor domain-containing protein [Blastocatellia bacterium]
MPTPADGRTKVFVSYSHQDEKWLKRVQVHLRDLTRRGLVELWDDKKIHSGDEWRKEIETALNSARVAVLLISADFIASDFIAANELPPLLAAAKKDGVKILSLILSPSRFEQIESLAEFQSVNPPSKPLIGLAKVEQEQFLVKLSDDVLRTVKEPLTSKNHLRAGTLSMSGKKRESVTDLTVQAGVIASRRTPIGIIITAVLTVLAAISIAGINNCGSAFKHFLSPLPQTAESERQASSTTMIRFYIFNKDIYPGGEISITATVLDAHGQIVNKFVSWDVLEEDREFVALSVQGNELKLTGKTVSKQKSDKKDIDHVVTVLASVKDGNQVLAYSSANITWRTPNTSKGVDPIPD